MRPGAVAVAVAVVTLVAGCAAPPSDGVAPTTPDARTHWVLRHRVTESQGLEVVGHRIGHWDEATQVSLADSDGSAGSDDCFVSIAVPGFGGPDLMTGEKVTTAFDHHPALRNGAGAEGDYLMWQLDDDAWVTVSCAEPGHRSGIDRVAAAVELAATPLPVPFDLDLPTGYGLSSIDIDLREPRVRVDLGRDAGGRSLPDADLAIVFDTAAEAPQPRGEPTTIGARPGHVDDDKHSPTVWLQEQNAWIRVGVDAGDTGPYPNRSKDLPVLRKVAESMTFAAGLTDPSTWFPADQVFG